MSLVNNSNINVLSLNMLFQRQKSCWDYFIIFKSETDMVYCEKKGFFQLYPFLIFFGQLYQEYANQILTALHLWLDTICHLQFHSILVTKSCGVVRKQEFYQILLFLTIWLTIPKCAAQILTTTHFWLSTRWSSYFIVFY